MHTHVVKQEPAESSPRAALAPLSIPDDSSSFLPAVHESAESAASSPSLSSALSPTPSDGAPTASASATKPQNPIIRRAISCSALAGPEGRPAKQRRKRSRVNPEQLIKLEEFFAMDNSPTSARRKDIAHQLGMDERQTQIWFQNRRAKAKLQLKLKSRTIEKLEPPPENPPELANGFDAGVHGLIHEDDEVTVFPCNDLTIGSWRRVASTQHDLIAYTSEGKRALSWFIRSADRSFKMDVSFDQILESRFTNLSPGTGSATFLLDRPPMFYMENVASPSPGEEQPVRFWQACGDWTEGMQGTTHLRHCLVGPAYQLSALVNSIVPTGASNEISLYTPTTSISDAGSSPEVYTRSLHSPIEQTGGTGASTLVLRRPSSLSSLRMLHHPSLERLRPRTSVPHFHSPLSLSGTSTPSSPYAPSDGSMLSMSPTTTLFLDGYDQPTSHQAQRQTQTRTPDQLTRLPLAMPDLPRTHYDYDYPCPPHALGPASRAESPYECAGEPSPSAASTPGYFDVTSPTHLVGSPWGGAPVPMPGTGGHGPMYKPQNAPAQERPQEPYYPYPSPHGFPPEHLHQDQGHRGY